MVYLGDSPIKTPECRVYRRDTPEGAEVLVAVFMGDDAVEGAQAVAEQTRVTHPTCETHVVIYEI